MDWLQLNIDYCPGLNRVGSWENRIRLICVYTDMDRDQMRIKIMWSIGHRVRVQVTVWILFWCRIWYNYVISNSVPSGGTVIWQGGWGGIEKFWKGCAAPVFATVPLTLSYRDWGPKSYPWLWKMGENQTLDNNNVTKLTTLKQFCMKLVKFDPILVICLEKKWWN